MYKLPFNKAVFTKLRFEPEMLDRTFQSISKTGSPGSGYFVLSCLDETYYIFFVEGRPFAVGLYGKNGFESFPLTRFFEMVQFNETEGVISLYACDAVLVKSILVFFQNRPTIQASGELLDIDSLLEKIRNIHSNLVMVVRHKRDSNIILFRKGVPIRAYFCNPAVLPSESTLQDRLLVYLYEHMKDSQFAIEVFQKIKVKPDTAVRALPETLDRGLFYYFNELTYRVKIYRDGQLLQTVPVQKDLIRIGRHADSDIILEDLGVSRQHSKIIKSDEGYVIDDLGSTNGIYVNGEKSSRHQLADGDRVMIGKHFLVFEKVEPSAVPSLPQEFMNDKTIHLDQAVYKLRKPAAEGEAQAGEKPTEIDEQQPPSSANAVVTSDTAFNEDDTSEDIRAAETLVKDDSEIAREIAASETPVESKIYVLESSDGSEIKLEGKEVYFGKGSRCDMVIQGWLIAQQHARIRRIAANEFRIEHLNGKRSVRVNGRKIKYHTLADSDRITIGNSKFMFYARPVD